MYSSMAKGTSWAEAKSNNENIKPVALAMKTSVSQSVENSTKLKNNKFF